MKKGVLIVNLGTPKAPTPKALRPYLIEFLTDGRVIDIPAWKRQLLVRLIIAPFRATKVSKEYQKLWTEQGSPLLIYGKMVREKLQQRLGDDYLVALGMRYQQPSIERALNELKEAKVRHITVISMFPQYASATSGSVAAKAMEVMQKWQVIPNVNFVQSYHNDPLFIEAFAEQGRAQWESGEFEHVLFSYHGIPERHLKKLGKDYNQCSYPGCQGTCAQGLDENHYCYRSACFETSQLIAERLHIPEEKYTVCFQSRLGKDPWIQPYTEDMVKELAHKGIKSVLAFSPAFVADCLETTIEVGEEYKEEFLEEGGERWELVESLNGSDKWIDLLEKLATRPFQPSSPSLQGVTNP